MRENATCVHVCRLSNTASAQSEGETNCGKLFSLTSNCGREKNLRKVAGIALCDSEYTAPTSGCIASVSVGRTCCRLPSTRPASSPGSASVDLSLIVARPDRESPFLSRRTLSGLVYGSGARARAVV